MTILSTTLWLLSGFGLSLRLVQLFQFIKLDFRVELNCAFSGHLARLSESIERVETAEGLVEFKCMVCGKTSPRRDTVANHVETLHFPGSYQCSYCSQEFSSKNNRNVHISRKHKYM